jgi:hypothetical protein
MSELEYMRARLEISERRKFPLPEKIEGETLGTKTDAIARWLKRYGVNKSSSIGLARAFTAPEPDNLITDVRVDAAGKITLSINTRKDLLNTNNND